MCISLHTLGSIAIFICSAARVASRCLRTFAFLFAAYLPSDPSLASSQPTRAGAYTVGHISWHGYVRTSPCVSDGVWFFGGVCFRLRAIFISVSSSWSSVVGVRVWSAVVRAWFGRRAWIPRRAIRYVRGNAVMHCRVHALVRPLIFVCQVNELPEIEGGGGQCYLPH